MSSFYSRIVGWFPLRGNHGAGSRAGRRLRSSLLLVLLTCGLTSVHAGDLNLLDVNSEMLSGSVSGLPAFGEPIPYGIVNNLTDQGWIWGSSSYLVVEFGTPVELNQFRVYVTYNGGERGANWVIEWSRNNSDWTHSADFAYLTSEGGGVDDSGDPVDGYGGWYEVTFNEAHESAQFWRVRQTGVIATHAPRSGEVQFCGIDGSSRPFVKSPGGDSFVRTDAVIAIELEDGSSTQVAPGSIELFLNEQAVTPMINKLGDVTTVTYDPPGSLPEGPNTVGIRFDDTSGSPVTLVQELLFTAVNHASAGRIINLDFNGARNDPGPDELRLTFESQGAGGGGAVWNGLEADSRLPGGPPDDDSLTVAATNLLDSIGDPTTVNFTIEPVGGDDEGTPSVNPQSERNLFGDSLLVGFQQPLVQPSEFTISGLGAIPVVDLYLYTSVGTTEVAGGFETFLAPQGIFDAQRGLSANTRFFPNVPVIGGSIEGSLDGNPGRLAGLTIVRPEPQPFVKSASPTEEAHGDVVISVELEDYVTQVDPGSIGLLFNEQAVAPMINKLGDVTTVTYDPPGVLPEGANSYSLSFEDTAGSPVFQTHDSSFVVVPDTKLLVRPHMLSGPTTFSGPAGLRITEPIPYGVANNTSDFGWIWDDSSQLDVDFGADTVMTRFRVYSVLTGEARGADWAIEASANGVSYQTVETFNFETTAGGGLDDDGTARGDHAGWYQVNFNENLTVAEPHWRIRQTGETIDHAPRVGQVEFHDFSEPTVRSFAPKGTRVSGDAVITVELEDQLTAVDTGSIALLVDGEAVSPTIDKPGGITTVTYAPPEDLQQGAHTIRIDFGNDAVPQVVKTHEFTFEVWEFIRVPVTPGMLSGLPFDFSEPIPYGIVNNLADQGWIWGNASELIVDFGEPQALNMFRVFSSYTGERRGALWRIEYSDDEFSWTEVADFSYETIAGVGVNDDGTQRADFGGWYEIEFNQSGNVGRYWRVSQVSVIDFHAPRSAQVEFLRASVAEFSQLPGDCNQDGALDLSDVVCLLGHLFQGNPEFLPCNSQAANVTLMDCNQDDSVDLSDAIYKLAYLFQGGPSPVNEGACIGMDCLPNPGCP